MVDSISTPLSPAWLPDLTVMDLQVGTQNFDLRFWRDGETTRWEVLKGDHDAVARRSYASGSHLRSGDEKDLKSRATSSESALMKSWSFCVRLHIGERCRLQCVGDRARYVRGRLS